MRVRVRVRVQVRVRVIIRVRVRVRWSPQLAPEPGASSASWAYGEDRGGVKGAHCAEHVTAASSLSDLQIHSILVRLRIVVRSRVWPLSPSHESPQLTPHQVSFCD